MIFKRRDKLGFWRRMREIASPRKGWRRGFQYIGKRVQRLPDTPHRIALGFACGAFASFTPFFTLHALVALAAAYALRANILASVFGTIVGNPLSFPLIAAVCMNLGNWILGRTDGVANVDNLSFAYVIDQPLEFLESIFTPYLIGGLVPGMVCAVVFYVLLKPAIAGFQRRRRDILAARARALIEARGQEIQQRARAAGADDDAGGPPSSGRPRRGRVRNGIGDALGAELTTPATPVKRLSETAPDAAETRDAAAGPADRAGEAPPKTASLRGPASAGKAALAKTTLGKATLGKAGLGKAALGKAASKTADGAADLVDALRKADPRLVKRPRSAS